MELLACEKKLKIMVDSLHNLPMDWLKHYSEFDISVNVYYGTRLMDTHSNIISKAPRHDALFPFVLMDFCVNSFTNINIGKCLRLRSTTFCVYVQGKPKSCSSSMAHGLTPKLPLMVAGWRAKSVWPLQLFHYLITKCLLLLNFD